ncbi:MAG: amino acid-binding domain protein [Clostridiales bacterium]|jgi:hypothetical protein|nr:amino acid-binding domain protein [Clostridiales bacterium]
MLIKQISVFLENKSGRLAEVTKVLAENNIDISALSIADTTDFGILRLILNQPEEAEKVLRENGFAVNFTNVIAIAVPDVPGGLASALEILEKEGIGIEYMYAFIGKAENEALVILRIEDNEKGIEALEKNNIKVLSAKTVYEL